ncbi:molybdenum ABC transporter ATP-binding protein [Orrella sp. NBD-18]|uniref:Molybdenum ABC transporter ATP-binding protein n=1 Tax=Sheuella amnicola TaxID=2707330 RepID=A0A6B2QZK2_9BURK|nr:molybdenum ABC transporter ATP-binding protein [Sheuella amnicola]NDY82734.1 molybdenum ABC transporter ATP-binding protein [Sheuella amnicola]HBI84170.1 molybdenum ABC transporter ATP-binding protein [Alcaligenaceae bacterium]
MINLALKLDRADFRLNIALELPSKGTTVIFGPSGGGKTTILRAIAGLEPDVRGIVMMNGQCWQKDDLFVPPHQRRVGFVFQHAGLLPHLSVQDNLRFGWRRAAGSQSQFDDCVAQLDLAPLFNRKISQLSGGERQRIALGRALLTQPDVLLFDEPLAALDAARRSEILRYLEQLKQLTSIPMIYVTHAVDEMSRLADYLVLMRAGQVRHAGNAFEVINRPDVPLALRDDAGIVVPATVVARDATGMLTLQSPLGVLFGQGAQQCCGEVVRVRLQARDVSIALSHHTDSSVLNILQTRILSLRETLNGQVLVELGAGDHFDQKLLARISQASTRRLNLLAGQTVWAQIKAVALLV